MGIFKAENEPRRMKLSQWFRGARFSPTISIIIGLLPSIIMWSLWSYICKSQMEGKNDMAEQVWLLVRHRLRILIIDFTSEYTPKTKLILENFMVAMK